MDFTDEWKSQFPVGKLFTPPLLLSDPSSRSVIGPLCFNPNPNTLIPLLSSPSLFPPILSPPPRISLSRFISTQSSLPLSTTSSISSQFGPQYYNDAVSALSYNRLHILHSTINNTLIVFFSTGYNHDQIGFLVVSSDLTVLTDEANDNGVSMAKDRFNLRISRILVNPVDVDDSSFQGNDSLVIIGYLLAFTMYSVHWYSVKASVGNEKPVLSYLGFKLFKSCSVVGACWSQHLLEESVVLLQNGDLFMFDISSCFTTQKKLNMCFKGKRLRVSWNDDDHGSSRNGKWLGCEFSWHPRILIVARSDAVFLVDLRCGECNISILAKIEMLNLYASVGREHFLTFCRAGSDGFHFVLASDSLLVLCDVRKPLMPVLQWAHSLAKPCYIDVFRLSELRSNLRDYTYEWANEFGFGIMLGSFWKCEFRLFCYGPSLPGHGGPFGSEISKVCKTLFAWELPSELRLSGRDCCCGNCLVREECLEDALPKWINKQQKKDIVLGFGILNKDLSALFHEADEFGGFTLIRLMSSGKLETQSYCASWDLVKKLEPAHGNSLLRLEDSLLCSMGDDDYKYKFPRRYQYMKLDYLNGYLSDNLTEVLDSKLKNSFNGPQKKDSFSIEVHENLCEKLKSCGFGRVRTSPATYCVFKNINLPTNIREVALMRTWAVLPMELLQIAFSTYTELFEVASDQKNVFLEFLAVPDPPQLPPFFLRKPSCRSNKWSNKVEPSDDAVVGPVLPFPIIVSLHEFRNGCPNSEEEAGKFSAEAEVSLHCKEVMQVADEMAVSDSGFGFQDDHAVSLSDDRDDSLADSQKPKPFILYHPTAFPSQVKDVRFSNLISKVPESEAFPKDKVDSAALDMFDDVCPVDLKFDDMNFMTMESKFCNVMKRHFTRWQEGCSPYQDFCTQFKLRRK